MGYTIALVACEPILPHERVVFNGATSNPFTHKAYGEKGIAGNMFSTGKQPLAPLELIFSFFYGMLSIFQWSGEGFIISVLSCRKHVPRDTLFTVWFVCKGIRCCPIKNHAFVGRIYWVTLPERPFPQGGQWPGKVNVEGFIFAYHHLMSKN